ncbi:MAG: hypothetical protein ACYTGX_13560 [Planctomycetota bacterium]
MANVLVIGVNPASAYPYAAAFVARGHRTCIAISREQALRKLLSGLVDTIVLDSGLDAATESAVFRAVQNSVEGLPRLRSGGELLAELAPVGAATTGLQSPSPARATRRPAPDITEGLMRAIAYLFGLLEGDRLGVAAEVTIGAAGEVRGIATAIKARDIQVEFLDRAAGAQLAELPLLGPDVPAVARLHFPGGGVLRVEGTVRPVIRRTGATALRLQVAPAAAGRPADVVSAAAPVADSVAA